MAFIVLRLSSKNNSDAFTNCFDKYFLQALSYFDGACLEVINFLLKSIEVHHFAPRIYKIRDKLFFCIITRINFRDGAKL